MPSWKKMAEAFGELAGRNMRRGRNSNVDTWSRNSANKSADTQNTYKAGKSFGSDLQRIADDLAAASERGETRYNQTSDQFYDQLKEVNQSNRGFGQSLEKDFEDEFEQAYKSALDRHDRQTAHDIIKDDKDLASQGVSEDDVHKTIQTNRKLDGGFDSDDDIRAQMIEELKSGVDLSDFFEKYR